MYTHSCNDQLWIHVKACIYTYLWIFIAICIRFILLLNVYNYARKHWRFIVICFGWSVVWIIKDRTYFDCRKVYNYMLMYDSMSKTLKIQLCCIFFWREGTKKSYVHKLHYMRQKRDAIYKEKRITCLDSTYWEKHVVHYMTFVEY